MSTTPDALKQEALALDAALRPLLTPTFLTTLVHAVRVAGHHGDVPDIVEAEALVRWCHDLVGLPCPELYHCYRSAFVQEPPLPPPLETPPGTYHSKR